MMPMARHERADAAKDGMGTADGAVGRAAGEAVGRAADGPVGGAADEAVGGLVRGALRSVVAVVVTPFDAAGELDEAAYAAVVTRMVRAGVPAITPNGNTGEFYSLTAAERDRAVELTVKAVEAPPEPARTPPVVIAGVGHDAAGAADAARRARRAGARAVMVHQPVHPYQSEAGWRDYHVAIAEAVPDLGVVCYVRSPLVTADALAGLAARCPNVIGVKYAVPEPLRFAALVEGVAAAAGPDRLVWVCGLAEAWAPFFWIAGAGGFTSGLANFAPELSLDLMARLRAGDHARAMALWRELRPIEDLRARNGNAGNVSVVKEALAQLGLCGRTVRPPITELDPAERDEVSVLLDRLGLAEGGSAASPAAAARAQGWKSTSG
jgi:4-hydroxy-tetrahydrodipicolinate synthase